MSSTRSVPAHPPHDDHQRILEGARQHPERTYREHVEAAERIAAVEYRAEIRKLAALDMLEPDEL